MLRRYIVLALGSIFLAIYLYRIDWSELQIRLANFKFDHILLILILNLVPGVVKTIRWRYFLGKSEIDTPLFWDYIAVNAAFFLGIVTPGTAGELSRVLSVGKNSRKAVAIMMFEKFTDLGVLFLLVITTCVMKWPIKFNLYIAFSILVLSVIAVYYLFIKYDSFFTKPIKFLLEKIFKEKRIKDIQLFYWDCYSLLSNRSFVMLSAITSLVLWILPLVQVQFISRGLGLNISWVSVAFIYFIPYFLSVVSLVPLGLGVFDLGVLEVTRSYGHANVAGLIPLCYRVFVTIPIILLGYSCQVLLALTNNTIKTSERKNSIHL